MTPLPARRHPLRSQRKQDLLLASQLARGQVLLAVDDLAERADALALRLARVRLWLGRPLVWAALGSALALALHTRRRRARRSPRSRLLRWVRLLRWGWLAWRTWHAAATASSPLRGPAPAPGAGPAADPH